MDFFSAVADPSQPIIHNDRPLDSVNDSFAEAIASRFGSSALLTTRLTPVTLAPPALRLPSSPMANMSLAPPPTPRSSAPSALPGASQAPIRFTTVTTATLGPWTDDPTALILDIRPHAAYSTARVPRAVSLSVPSTLLKRPLFSLHRLADMLPSANARARFSSWRSASRILVYDADSSAILESSNIYGLLRKFKNDGFQGDLAWLKGGLQAVWREKRDIIDARPPTPDAENDDDDDDENKLSPTQTQPSVLRTRHLPMAAFSFSSTVVSTSPSLNPNNPKRGPLSRGATFPKLPTPSHNQPQPAYNPFFDAVRQNLELSQGITERIPLRLPRRVRHRIHDLPLPWLREIVRRAAKLTPRNRSVIDSSSSTSEESEDDENITSADVEEGKEALAMQFFKVEVAEQRRLMGIMEHHTKETAIVTSDTDSTPASNFPYSITAGVEKGTKNRYRHIWPFEHARVKLHQSREAGDDYVNASYVQPLGTNKRYIATQGPLPTTFTDFWTLCWEQNVHVIVMLTREVENSMVKCGSYWTDTTYGPLRLRLVSTAGASPPAEELGLFPARPAPQYHLTSPVSGRIPQQCPVKYFPRRHTPKNETIRRVFELTHTLYPNVPPRRIIHFQYLEWPDMNVPDDPRGLLELVKQVDDAMKATRDSENASSVNSGLGAKDTPTPASTAEIDGSTGIAKQAMGNNRPVLLHCSAGVGRTGGFIAVDAVLDAIRREMRKKSEQRQEVGRDENAMEVDTPSGSTSVPDIVSPVAAEKDDPMSNQGPSMETVSITITAGNGHRDSHPSPELIVHVPVIPTPSSDGTEPEASGSERENPSCDKLPSALAFTTKTREWAEDVSRADGVVSFPGTNQEQRHSGSFESGLDALPSSNNAQQPSVPSDESSSSRHSLLDLSYTGANANTDPSGSYYLPHSSSLATSISTSASTPSSSPPNSEPLLHSLSKDAGPDNSASPAFLSADCIPARSVSQPLNSSRTHADHGLEPHPGFKADPGGNEILPQASLGWLGERVRRRSPSPMARAISGSRDAVPILPQKPSHTTVPSFTLHAPPYTGGISSDAEPPSRSVSPSADEGSVASQVSSYHSYLKHHHYQPIHVKSLPINMDKPGKEKGVRLSRVPALVPERLGSPVQLHTAPVQTNSGWATAVDYKQPRPLHGTVTPPDLSSFEEPICEVIQDMREQRMSLCQSLRQYVFIHAAILEGALMIVDEEKEIMKEKEREHVVEMGSLKIEREWGEKVESLRVTPQGAGSGGTGGCEGGGMKGLHGLNEGDYRAPGVSASSIGRWGEKRGSRRFVGRSNMATMTPTEVPPSRRKVDSMVESENDGYFERLTFPGPASLGIDGESVDENAMEADVLLRPRNPGGLVFPPAFSLQRPRHPGLDGRPGKRSTSPGDHLRGGASPLSLDDGGLLKRPSIKRKQPSGESGEAVTRKRAQNESSSRERERERERGLERRLSNSSHSHSRDGALDLLTSGLVG